MKKRLLCSHLPLLNKSVSLSETEAHHATTVLRMRDGDVIQALDGKGHAAWVRLRTRQGPTRIEAIPESEAPPVDLPTPASSVPFVLEMSVLKGDAMEWVIEKAVELGVQKLVPIMTIRTVVRMDRKGPEEFQARWQKIAQQALKQCGRLDQMEVATPLALEELVVGTENSGSRLWCDEEAGETSIEILDWLSRDLQSSAPPLRTLIGPEGGWDPREREILLRTSNTVRIQLGPLTLRAETAALYSVSLVSAFLRKKN
jgi:16S rRNA (uracil1498-N3)-methyltransferase